jgi:hypothetical protein
MSLPKPSTMTSARLEANRRNARRSTGPRTTRGKAQARLNGLGHGPWAPFYYDFKMLLMEAPPHELEKAVPTVLTPEETDSRLFKGLMGTIQQADFELAMHLRKAYRVGSRKEDFNSDVRSRNVVENKRQLPGDPSMLLKNKQVSRFSTNVYEKNDS